MNQGAYFSAKDICDHPDRSHIKEETTNEDRLKLVLRENIFTNRDPICVNCMKCVCPSLENESEKIPCERCDYSACLISERN